MPMAAPVMIEADDVDLQVPHSLGLLDAKLLEVEHVADDDAAEVLLQRECLVAGPADLEPRRAERGELHGELDKPVARRGVAPQSVFETVMLKLQKDVNATRKRLALHAGVAVSLYSEDEIAYKLVCIVINPLGHVIGFEESSAEVLQQLSSGTNNAAALERLCRLEPPFPPSQ